jgi:hypothetical protein
MMRRIYQSMDYWHEIIKSYDNIEIEGSSKYYYSESTAALILIVLAFGKDHAYNIALMFDEWGLPDELFRGSVLKNPNKMAVVLNKMNEDGFVVLENVKVANGRGIKFYKINPMIIQSPTISSPYERPDGTIFEIPLDLVERFLTWLGEFERHISIKEQLIEALSNCKKFDYISFLSLIKGMALQWEEKPENTSEFASRPRLSQLIDEYIKEVNKPIDSYVEAIERVIEKLERVGFSKDEGTIIIKNGKVKVKKES